MGAAQGCSHVQKCTDVAAPIRAGRISCPSSESKNRLPQEPAVLQEKTYMTSQSEEDTALPISARSGPPTAREPFEPIWTDRRPHPPELPQIQEESLL